MRLGERPVVTYTVCHWREGVVAAFSKAADVLNLLAQFPAQHEYYVEAHIEHGDESVESWRVLPERRKLHERSAA